MADNVSISEGSGKSIATDDVAGQQYQRVKWDVGGDGASSPLVRGALTAANSIPVALATDDPAAVSLALLDDCVVTDDAAIGSAKALMIGFRFDDTLPDSVDEGDAGYARMSGNRSIYTQIRDAAGNERGLNVDANGAIALGSVSPGAGSANLGKAEDAAHTSGDVGVFVLAVRNDAGTVLAGTDGDYIGLTTNATGELRVTGSTGGTSMVDDAAFTVGGTSFTPSGGTYKATLDSVDDGDGGAFSMTIKRALYVSHLTPLGDSMVDDSLDALKVTIAGGSIPGILDDAAFGIATQELLPIAFLADESSTDSVNEGDAGAARMTLDRKQVVAQYAHTAGGWTPVSTVSAASTNATSLKGSAGQVGSVTCTNINAGQRYLKFYNKATAPTVGTDVPVYVYPIPGNTAGAGVTHSIPAGIEFTTGIAWALTTGPTVADTGAVAASEIVVSIAYK